MIIEIFLVVIGLFTFFVLVFLLFKNQIAKFLASLIKPMVDENVKAVEQKSKEVFEEIGKRLKEKVQDEIGKGEKDIAGKKEAIAILVENIEKRIKDSETRLERSDSDRVSAFTNLKTIIEQHVSVTQTLQTTTDNLRKIMSNNQLRGSFGQEVAEDLLKMAGFVKGQNYTSQEQQTSGHKPDFTVLLPDDAKINIDVKFPFQALQKYQETEDKEQRKQYLAEFKRDIKDKIEEITSRDYINPAENTVDFVVMFIPNEMIFSFIYEQFSDVWRDAIAKKVMMCGPFSFTAILRMVQKSYDNFKYQKDLQGIITQIKIFEIEYEKFNKSLDVLGKKLLDAHKQYDEVSGVRDRKLVKVIERIKMNESLTLTEVEPMILEGPTHREEE